MHPLYIWLLTLFLIYLIVFYIKTLLIYLINIIIIIYFKCFGLCLLYVTLHRLIPARQSYDCHYFVILLFLILLSSIWISHFTTFSASQNRFNRKWIKILLIRVIQLLFMMSKFYFSKMTKKTILSKLLISSKISIVFHIRTLLMFLFSHRISKI